MMTPEDMNVLARRMMLPVEERLANTEDEVVRQGEQILAIIAQVPALLAEVEYLRTMNAAVHLDNAEGQRAKGEVFQLQMELSHQDEEIERLRAENAALREVAELAALARWSIFPQDQQHWGLELRTKAREALGKDKEAR